MYPRLRPPQRGQTKPFGQRCAVRCSPHRTSSPKRERNSLTVMMDFRFNRLGFFISDILSPFIRLFKLDIHQTLLALLQLSAAQRRDRREQRVKPSFDQTSESSFLGYLAQSWVGFKRKTIPAAGRPRPRGVLLVYGCLTARTGFENGMNGGS